ncbi:uncharacterized protein [Spinacia oleracea]|uniref:ATP-dependent DNA helicase n=1 Tax=Spinacia oleracea TaxID=3562 RepID=A0A9R0JM83_SPIOL|nr:uncharacterized protein LOC110779746 [Spinacia oleracea]
MPLRQYVDRSLRDIMQTINQGAEDKPFGGKTVVLGGDFRKILPVVPRKGRPDIVDASVSRSPTIWPHCTVFKLTTNMRLRGSTTTIGKEQMQAFSKWVLDVGDGNISSSAKSGEDEATWIQIPTDLLVKDHDDKKVALVEEIYPDLLHRYKDINYLSERAILAPKNECVDEINNYILSMIPGEERVYTSADRVSPLTNRTSIEEDLYPTEFLNTLQFPGIPNHEMRLKVDCPIILLRNINQVEGLCNGTRLIITRLEAIVIEAQVVTGKNVGRRVSIPRVEMTPSNHTLPFTMKRRQFPVKEYKACKQRKTHLLSSVNTNKKPTSKNRPQRYLRLHLQEHCISFIGPKYPTRIDCCLSQVPFPYPLITSFTCE